MMKRLLSVATALVLALGCAAFAACEEDVGNSGDGSEQQQVAATSVTLSETSLTLEAGKTAVLTATVLPENATDKTIVWSSSDKSVVTVSDGTVTAVAAGSATVTAACGTADATCAVTVTAAQPVYGPVTQEEWTAAFGLLARDPLSIDWDMASYAQGETPVYSDYLDYAVEDGKEELHLHDPEAGSMDAYVEKVQGGYLGYSVQNHICMVQEVGASLQESFGGPFGMMEQMFTLFSGMYETFASGYRAEDAAYAATFEINGSAGEATLRFAGGELVYLQLSGENGGGSGTGGDAEETVPPDDHPGQTTEDDAVVTSAPRAADETTYISYILEFAYTGISVTLPAPEELSDIVGGEELPDGLTASAFDFDVLENFALTAEMTSYDAEGRAVSFGTAIEYARADGKEKAAMYVYSSEAAYSVETADGKHQMYTMQNGEWKAYGGAAETSLYVSARIGDTLAYLENAQYRFDAEKGCYTAHLDDLDGSGAADISVWIVGGKIVRIIVDQAAYINESEGLVRYVFSVTHGGQSIELPFTV